jgi:hypothetical protein
VCHEKIEDRFFEAIPHRTLDMDAEHINAIGSEIDDLKERAEALRGYL